MCATGCVLAAPATIIITGRAAGRSFERIIQSGGEVCMRIIFCFPKFFCLQGPLKEGKPQRFPISFHKAESKNVASATVVFSLLFFCLVSNLHVKPRISLTNKSTITIFSTHGAKGFPSLVPTVRFRCQHA